MKIIQIMPEFGLAGAEIMCESLTYELIKLGHSVIVLSMYDYHSAITERMEAAGVDVRYLGKKPGLDFSMIGKMKKIFKEEKPDAVHTHRYVMEYAVPAAVMAGVKRRVHTVHNVARKENTKTARMLNKIFYKCFGAVPVALSGLIQGTVAEEYKIKKEKIPVIFNGINLSKCRPKESYEINGNFKILHIGRFSEQKNHIGLLKAFQMFHEKHPDSELWLIGDGEKRVEIEEYVKDNALTSAVKFLGLQSDVYGYLHDADIFTLPSLYEGIPMTLIEAMGTGLPIAATAVGGVPDMLDSSCAALIQADGDELISAFEEYYINADKREAHGSMAKEKSEAFSSAKMCESYLKVYSDTFRNSRGI